MIHSFTHLLKIQLNSHKKYIYMNISFFSTHLSLLLFRRWNHWLFHRSLWPLFGESYILEYLLYSLLNVYLLYQPNPQNECSCHRPEQSHPKHIVLVYLLFFYTNCFVVKLYWHWNLVPCVVKRYTLVPLVKVIVPEQDLQCCPDTISLHFTK